MDSLPDQFDDDGGYSHYPDPEDLPQFTWPLVPAPQNEVYGLDEIRYDDYSPEYGSEESTGLPDDTPLGFPRDDSSNDPDFLEGDFDSDEIEDEESMSDEESAEDNSIPRGMRSRVYKRKQGQPFNLDAIKARKTKTGYRKPLEPTQRFKDTLAHATAAFLAGDYDRAYGAIQQAIAINPEIYSAHSLLSEIHLARGDKIEASVALFQAAHTKCRDPEIWMRLAGLISETSTEGRESTVSDMIYCYSRVISYKADHFEARLKRATLLRERGQAAKALLDYLKLRRGDFQFDTTLLRYLAETYSELNEHHMAIELYDDTIIHLQSMGTSDFISLGWSDMNIYAELFIHAKEPQEGLFKLKGAARWLLQREDETFWVEFAEDDREFDKHDHPRRSMVPEFIPNVHPASSYGDGLPLELRIKLGLLRLLQGGTHVNEAMRHFSWLLPDPQNPEALVFDFPDLFREVAMALQTAEEYREALRFFEPILQVQKSADTPLFVNLAICFRETSQFDKAESCYLTAIDREENNLELLRDLAKMFSDASLEAQARSYLEKFLSVKREHIKRAMAQYDSPDISISSIEGDGQDPFHIPKLLLKPKSRRGGRRNESDTVVHEPLRDQFLEMEALTGRIQADDAEAKREWMSLAKDLFANFVNVRVFYPDRRYERFFGFSREARMKAIRMRPEDVNNDLFQDSNEADSIQTPSGYAGITFDEWLNIFLEYAILLSEDGEAKTAYSVLKSAMDANVFFHNKDHVFAIQIVWSLCALKVNDSRTICQITRALMLQYQFVTDSYRLYAVLNRLCGRPNLWYNSGSSQKFILRQIKAVDFSLLGEGFIFREKAAFTNKDQNGNPVKAEGMDIEMLLLYGQLLCAGGGHLEGLNYFYRAHALDSDHPLILLSLALGYIHHSLKRQAANRHTLIAQGFTFLHAYRTARADAPLATDAEKQEVEFNFGRAYMTVGLAHLAVPCFGKVLQMDDDRRGKKARENNDREMSIDGTDGTGCEGGENYALEAAYQLQGIWALSGQTELALKVTEKWLIL